jgi:hypothetical protein
MNGRIPWHLVVTLASMELLATMEVEIERALRLR